MRIYHQYYRQKNPDRRSHIRGKRKEVYETFLSSLEKPGGRRRNPGEMIDAFNLLGELNRSIEDGHDEFVPLRDIVQARIEGYINKEAMSYSLGEAIRNLSSAQISIVKQMIADAGGEVSPEERRAIDIAAARSPSVLRAKTHLERAKQADEAFRAAIRAGRLSSREFQIGPERKAAMLAQQRGAREELGTERYIASDKKLWKRVEADLLRKYPEKFIPAKTESRRRQEYEALLKMSHVDTPRNIKENIRKRLQTALANRWKTARILAYEARGGKERERDRALYAKREVSTPFELGDGFFGVVYPSKKNEVFQWALFDKSKSVYMQGVASKKSSASRNAGIAYRILMNLVELGDAAGWDHLPEADVRWLEKHRPTLSASVARMLLLNVNERRRIHRDTALWLASAARLPKLELAKEADVSRICADMTVGEERVFSGEKNLFTIHVKKGSGGKFTFYVQMPDGRKSAARRMQGCDDLIQKASVIGGAMVGGLEVAKVISNPQKIKRLQNSAQKFFRKKNPSPKIERESAKLGDIRELTGMIGIPADSKEAYRYGFYAGIIRGIDTCGVQNYFKRKKIRNEFQQRLIDAAMEATALVTGTKTQKRGRVKTHYTKPRTTSRYEVDEEEDGPRGDATDAVDDIDNDLLNLLSGWRGEV